MMKYKVHKPEEYASHIYEDTQTVDDYELLVRVFETGDFHIEVDGGELTEYYYPNFTDTDDLIDVAWLTAYDVVIYMNGGC